MFFILLVAMAIIVVAVVVGSGSVFLVCIELLSMYLQCLGKMALFFFSVVLHTVALLIRNASTHAIEYQVLKYYSILKPFSLKKK